MKPRSAWCAAGVIAACLGAGALRSESENRAVAKTALSARALKDIASVEAEINSIEDQTLADVKQRSLDPSQKIILLGKLIFYDRQLSVRRNEACAFCHMPETGFTGPVSALNQTTVSYPGSIVRASESAPRKLTPMPASHPYCTTTRSKAIWWAGPFGTCVQRDSVLTVRWLSRRKGRRSIRMRWE